MAKLRREELQAKVTALVEPLLGREGFELVEVEIVGSGPGTILRLYIDKPGGVTLDNCADVSHAVSAMMDVEDPFDTTYNLEVSSPGLDRPLRKPSDFVKYSGRKVRVKTFGPIEGAGSRKVFVGKLLGFENEMVKVDVDGTPYAVPHNAIAKANLEWSPDDADGDEGF